MYTKHFLRMLIGLLGMAILGLVGLFLINTYYKEKQQETTVPLSTFPESN